MKNLSRAAVFLLCLLAGILTANFIWAAEKIDINTAPLEDLVKIIHIGEARALELISLRPFASLDDLIKIKGIGEARLKDIKEQGLAWASQQTPLGQSETPEERPVLPAASAEEPVEAFEENVENPDHQNPGTSGSPLLFSAIIALAAFSGAIILLLKKSLK